MGATGAVASFGGAAWVGSALIHGSLAAVIAFQSVRQVAPPPPPMTLIDVLVAPAEPPPPPPPPPPLVPETLPLVAAPPLSNLPPSPVRVTTRAATSEPAKDIQPVAVAEPQSDVGPVVTASAPAGPTFIMALPLGTSSTSTVAKAAHDEVFDEKGVSARAEVAFGPTPAYPAAARAAEVETDVPVELVVDATGRVVSARVTRHIGYGLDEATLDAIRRYRFSPAQRDGHAVAVRMLWTMQFRLQ